MKRLISLCLSLIMCCGVWLSAPIQAKAAGSLEAALDWAVAIANDDGHWYGRSSGDGPNYDCSSFVYWALRHAGFDVGGTVFVTGSMRGILTARGFTWVPWSQINNKDNLQRGDILLDESAHTEFYLGGGKCVAAANDDDGIVVEGFWNNMGGVSWDGILRYTAPVVPDKPTLSVSATTSASPVSFLWNACANTNWYDVRIYKSDDTNIVSEMGIQALSYSYSLSAGSYYANVASVNENGNYTFSDNVSFTVADPPKQLTMNYNINGGTIAADADYTANDNGTILVKSSGNAFATVWDNGSGSSEYGLTNASTFKLTREGYKFLGWSLAKDSGTIFDQDNTKLIANDIYPDVSKASAKVTFYARWERISVKGDINTDGEIDRVDVELLMNWLLAAPKTTLKDAEAADMNGDGKLNAVDLTMLKRQVLINQGIIITLNKSALTLNTEGKSKSYQLTCSYPVAEDVVWKSSNVAVATVKNGLVTAQKDGTVTITATANGVSVSCKLTVKTAYTDTWSDWSDWTATPITASEIVEVKTEDRSSQVLVSYNIDYYCTRTKDKKRQFRNYSINPADYGLDTGYGQNTTQTAFGVPYLVKTVDELNAVAKIQPGEWSTGSQAGQNCADVVGYSFDGCIFYILGENYDTVSTTYYSSRHLVKTPVQYKN